MGRDFQNSSGSISDGKDFQRIWNLPRKEKIAWDEVAEELSRQLRTPAGNWDVRPIQAEVLCAVAEHEGSFASVGVGGGKTLVSFLAGTVSDCHLVVVIVPAKLREKTRRNFAELSGKFINTSFHHVISAEELGLRDGLERLTEYGDPDMIVIDECHKFKNGKAARTRKLLRYLKKRREDRQVCKLLAMSGTITSRGIKDFAHLLEEALGAYQSPLPLDPKELNKWARVVDPQVESRCNPGPFIHKLKYLNKEGLDYRVANAGDYRELVHWRIFETPGAIKLPGTAFGGPIELEFLDTGPLGQEIDEMLARLIEDRIQPNGDECFPGDIYRHTRCLCLGFWYDFDPPPPEHWKTARRIWRSYCRAVLEQEIPGLDSEFLVANAVTRGYYYLPDDPERVKYPIDDGGALERWREVKGDYDADKNRVARWVTDSILREIVKGADVLNTPQLVWSDFRAVGEKLHELFGLPYYANKGLNAEKGHIMDCPGDVSPVLSVEANSEGFDLQDRWNRALYLTPMQGAQPWEQTIGRIHRPGQLQDQVELKVVANHRKLRDAFDVAVKRTEYVQTMQGAPQKLLLADVVG